MGVINIHNISNHNQTFEVHGWNQKTTTVGAGQMATFQAPDGSSGAIIALHDGFDGEQAEITKAGWNGNDTFDTSVEVGAGGNMTVQQWGDDSTRKGAPTFMQDCNNAWHHASQNTKNAIRQSVTLDGSGNIIRIGAPKNSQALQSFVRTFAEGKTYIGTGSWAGSAGDPGDNAQSSAAHGSRDIIVTYNDGNASPTLGAGHPNTMAKFAHRASVEMTAVNPEHAVARDATQPKPGIQLGNKSHQTQTYNFYNNTSNWNGGGVPAFNNPLTSTTLAAGASTFVPLPTTFKGRVQRGTVQPSTWVEFQISAKNDHAAWGDISLEMGCDGAATISATDGSGTSSGFSNNIISGAPAAALVKNPNGQTVIDTTQGYWGGGPNRAASDYENRVVGQKKAYILGGMGTDMAHSSNQCLAVEFY